MTIPTAPLDASPTAFVDRLRTCWRATKLRGAMSNVGGGSTATVLGRVFALHGADAWRRACLGSNREVTMTLRDRLCALAEALPSDSSAVTLTRTDLLELLEREADGGERAASARDLTVEDVAAETGRAASTVRTWLISGALNGYKLNRPDWRVPRASLQAYLKDQRSPPLPLEHPANVDIAAWRRVRRAGETR